MDELLLQYVRGRTTADENRSVEAWLRETPEAEAEVNDLRRLVDLARAPDLEVEPGTPPATDLVVREAEARRAAAIRRADDRARRRPARSRFGLFAGWATAGVFAAAAWSSGTTGTRPRTAREGAAWRPRSSSRRPARPRWSAWATAA